MEVTETKMRALDKTLTTWQLQLELETQNISSEFITDLLDKVDAVRQSHVDARASLMNLRTDHVSHDVDVNENDVECDEQKRRVLLKLVDDVASHAVRVYKMLLRKTRSFAPFMQYWYRINNMTAQQFAGTENWERQYAFHVMFSGSYAARMTQGWSDIGVTELYQEQGFTDLDGVTYGNGLYCIDCDCGCQIAADIYVSFTVDTIYAGLAETYDYRIHLKD